MHLKLKLGLLILGAAILMTQTSEAQREDRVKPPSITVLGSGESHARPDVGFVSVGVVNDGKTAQETSAENAKQTQQVVAALRKAGVAEKDIQTSGYSVQPIYKNNDYSQGIAGYRVSNNVRAIARKLNTLGSLIDIALEAGANNVQGVGFGLEKRQGAEDEALIEAVADARRKAEIIARAAGLRIVGVREISAAPNQGPRPMMAMESFRGGMAAATPIQPGELDISAQVTAVFDIAPAARRATAK
jgi:uncharacterized protein YggE